MGQRISVVVVEDGKILAGFYDQWAGYTEKVHQIAYSAFNLLESVDKHCKETGRSPMDRAIMYLRCAIEVVFNATPSVDSDEVEEYGVDTDLLEKQGISITGRSGLAYEILLGESAEELFGLADGYAIFDIGEKLSTHIKDEINNNRYYLNDSQAFSLLEVRSWQEIKDYMEGNEEIEYDEVLGNDEVVVFHKSESREGSLYQYETDNSDDDEWDMDELEELYKQKKNNS